MLLDARTCYGARVTAKMIIRITNVINRQIPIRIFFCKIKSKEKLLSCMINVSTKEKKIIKLMNT